MALENSMLVMNGKQVGGNTQDLTGYQTKVDNNLETENKEIVEAINELRSEKADTDIVAADFNTGTSYTAGNYCIYEGKFYKFKASHTGAWSAADVDEIKIAGELASLKSGLTGLTGLLKYKDFNITASDTTNHLYNTGVSASQYVCVGGCTPYNPNLFIEISNVQITVGGDIRYRLYDVATQQVVSDNAAYAVYLVFVDKSMLSELVITP